MTEDNQPPAQPNFQPDSFWKRNAPMLKAALIFVLILLLLIPQSMISSLIQERQQRQDEVLREVAQTWGSEQQISGPVLVIPYQEFYLDDDDKLQKTIREAYFLPEQFNVNGNLQPKKLHRSLYDVVVYNSELQLTGMFLQPDLKSLGVKPEHALWNDARIVLGVSDARGIDNDLSIELNGTPYPFKPGVGETRLIDRGVQATVNLSDSAAAQNYPFNMSIRLNGTQSLRFIPVGKSTDVQLSSSWKDPSFIGNFSPDNREVSDDGFTVNWNIINLNRNFPQSWTGYTYNFQNSDFGVDLLLPVDHYQKSMRSVKYAILFIALTFLIFFFVEMFIKRPVHPIQYILIGLALIIFYTLLVSISEQWNFNGAYLISSAATLILIALYARSIFKSWNYAFLTGGVLVLLYGFIFTIIQLQDLALLLGSCGLFVIIAALMFFSRKIDWYGRNR